MVQAYVSFKDRGESAKVLVLAMASNLDISLTIANPQASSPYFSLLPAEIRELMHSFVVHFPVIHIKNRPGWHKGWLCCRRHSEICDNRLFIDAVVESEPLLAFWAFPLTCRLAYAEEIPTERLSLQGAKERDPFWEKVINLKALDDCVHTPRRNSNHQGSIWHFARNPSE
jgi:hypothetical protein